MAKHYRMQAETGHLRLTGQNVQLIHTVRKKTVEKNPLLIAVYLFVTVSSIVASYFTSGWISVAVAFSVPKTTAITRLFRSDCGVNPTFVASLLPNSKSITPV
ncbi:MAG: hypothetical protein K8F62_14585, partial [Pseudorhodoplanes sp.]|nr:hypothetical protein [Pseudorhodoplanes sp.]